MIIIEIIKEHWHDNVDINIPSDVSNKDKTQ